MKPMKPWMISLLFAVAMLGFALYLGNAGGILTVASLIGGVLGLFEALRGYRQRR